LFTNVFNPEIGDGENTPDIISMQNKSIDPKEADFILKAFEELKKEDETLYNEMIQINFFQTGVVQSPVSFYSLIPYNDVLPIVNNLIDNHTLTVDYRSQENVKDNLMANIGMKLNNIQRVNFKEGDSEFGNIVSLSLDRTKGKDYILFSQTKKVKVEVMIGGKPRTQTVKETKQGIFKHMGDNRYDLLQPQNYKTLFYNLTSEELTFVEQDEEINNVEEIEETTEEIVEQPNSWSKLTPTQQVKFNGYGITEENFNSWNPQKQTLYVKCNG